MATRAKRNNNANAARFEAMLKKSLAIISRRPEGISRAMLAVRMKDCKTDIEKLLTTLRIEGKIQPLKSHTFGTLWFSMAHLPAGVLAFAAEKLRLKQAMHRRSYQRNNANRRARQLLIKAGLPLPPPKPRAEPKPKTKPADPAFAAYANPARKWPSPVPTTERRKPPSSVFELAKYL